MLQCQEYLILYILVDLFAKRLYDYWSYTFIHNFEYTISNVGLGCINIQYEKACFRVFTTDTRCHGGKSYIKIKLTP